MNKEIKKKDSKTSSSILVGVLVCFVLIAVYGIVSQLKVSYAFPNTLEEIKNVKEVWPEQPVDDNDQPMYHPTGVPTTWYTDREIENKMVGHIVVEGKTTPSYTIDMFCLESEKNMPDSTTEDESHQKIVYKKAQSQTKIDEGINYIVLQAYNSNSVNENTSVEPKTVTLGDNDYFDVQTALWIYQNNNAKDADKVEEFTTMWNDIKTSSNSHAKKIKALVDGAQAAKESTVENDIALTGSTEFKLNSDETYYETEDLTVTVTTAPNTEFSGFKLVIDNDSNVDIDVVDSTNTVIQPSEYATKIGSGGTFKFRIKKADLPTNTTVGITGQIKGDFKHMGFTAYEGYIGTSTTPSTSLQIALVPVTETTPKSVTLSASIEIPDTGAGFSGYIYIIGAMVLIVGLTIIYVNTKVQEN